jgi:hypothetical protein
MLLYAVGCNPFTMNDAAFVCAICGILKQSKKALARHRKSLHRLGGDAPSQSGSSDVGHVVDPRLVVHLASPSTSNDVTVQYGLVSMPFDNERHDAGDGGDRRKVLTCGTVEPAPLPVALALTPPASVTATLVNEAASVLWQPDGYDADLADDGSTVIAGIAELSTETAPANCLQTGAVEPGEIFAVSLNTQRQNSPAGCDSIKPSGEGRQRGRLLALRRFVWAFRNRKKRERPVF